MTVGDWWHCGNGDGWQVLPPIRDDIHFCEECESAYIEGGDCECDHASLGAACEVCGEPCFGSRCQNHLWYEGQDITTVADTMAHNNLGERIADAIACFADNGL